MCHKTMAHQTRALSRSPFLAEMPSLPELVQETMNVAVNVIPDVDLTLKD